MLLGCTKQISDEDIEREMKNMSDEELNIIIKQAESGERPMVGQTIFKVSSDKAAKIAYKIQLERAKSIIDLLYVSDLPNLEKARPECGDKICEENKGESFSYCPLDCPQQR